MASKLSKKVNCACCAELLIAFVHILTCSTTMFNGMHTLNYTYLFNRPSIHAQAKSGFVCGEWVHATILGVGVLSTFNESKCNSKLYIDNIPRSQSQR
jgi:hypothetical protein